MLIQLDQRPKLAWQHNGREAYVSMLSATPHPKECGAQWLKWFCEAAGAHLTKPGWSKPRTRSNPTNLALFRHKTTL